MDRTQGVVAALALCIGSVASGQGGHRYFAEYEYGPGGVVSPTSPTVTVRISVDRGGVGYAFAMSRFLLTAGDGRWEFVDWGELEQGQLWSRVSGQGTAELNVFAHQDNTFNPWPYTVNANPVDPIRILTARWTAEDFTPRLVPISTSTTEMYYYLYRENPTRSPLLPVELQSSIRVIPTPPGAALLMLAMAGVRRRRA